MYNLDGGCILANFLSFPTFLNRFRRIWLKITYNCKFRQKSGLDWVKMAKFGYFAQFSIFSPKMKLRLTRNGQFHPIHNFSHLLPPKCLIFGEISKIFILGGVYISKFFDFSKFFKSFHTNAAENDPQLQIWPKMWLRLGQNGQFGMFFYLFPQIVLVFKCYIHAICDRRFHGGGGQAHKIYHDHSHTRGSWWSTWQSTIPFNMTILDTVPKQTTFKLNFNTFITYLSIIYILTHIISLFS